MMIRQDIQELKTGRRELRNFGLVVGGVFVALGLFFWARGKPYFPYCLLPGVALVLAGLLYPRALKQVFIGWMAVAIVLGFIISHVILTAFFFLIVTPIGWIARLAGKDFLSLKLDRQAQSYWKPRPPRKTRQDYEQQF
ncbi:MAG TPA: SxtJ family membrane protein [Clostridia bacterium]|nr:SxtJ family membrane protein [Clostridia bacterium]